MSMLIRLHTPTHTKFKTITKARGERYGAVSVDEGLVHLPPLLLSLPHPWVILLNLHAAPPHSCRQPDKMCTNCTNQMRRLLNILDTASSGLTRQGEGGGYLQLQGGSWARSMVTFLASSLPARVVLQSNTSSRPS